jgi:biotin transport system substrate-specific component
MTMNKSLVASFWTKAGTERSVQAALIVVGVVLLALSSKIQVPFWPVPMTLQTAAVLLIGATYGLRLGSATLLAYLGCGAIGLPVFASGAGLAYMTGPTGGYLLGFLAAVVVMGWLADKGWGRTLPQAVGLMLLGEIVLFALGIAWLAALIGPDKALAGGLVPFLPAETLKATLAAAVLSLGWSRAKEI